MGDGAIKQQRRSQLCQGMSSACSSLAAKQGQSASHTSNEHNEPTAKTRLLFDMSSRASPEQPSCNSVRSCYLSWPVWNLVTCCSPYRNEMEELVQKTSANPAQILFLRPSNSVFPFCDPTGVCCLTFKDYSGVPLERAKFVVDRFSVLVVHARRTDKRLPLDKNDSSSSPTKILKQCIRAVGGLKRPAGSVAVALLVAGVPEDEASSAIKTIREAWDNQSGIAHGFFADVHVFCCDNQLSNEQEAALRALGSR